MSRNNGYVVVVTMVIRPDSRKMFHQAVLANAATSLSLEPDCSIFEVSESRDGSEIFLYEVYKDEAAFEVHLASDHFRRFDALVAPWITDKRVMTFHRLAR